MRKQYLRWAGIALAGLLTVTASSCGKQDLYELPESPYVEVGHLPLPTINLDVDILGNYAFVAAGQAGLHVVDISNPAEPLLVKTLDTTRNPIAIRVVRSFVDHEILDTVLLSEGTEGLRTYDVTNPLEPVDYNQFTTAINAQDFTIREPEDPDDPFLVVMGDDWKGIRFFASNPAFPGILDYDGVFEKTFGEAQDVAWKGNYVFVADDQTGLTVMDASVIVLGSIEIVATVDTPGNAVRIDIEGDYAYIADKRKGLAIFDISDPLDPVHVYQMPLDSWCLNVEVVGHLAFIAGDDAGMHIVDVSDPTHPVYAGNVRSANATSIAVREDGLVLLTDEDDGLRVMQGPAFADVTPPAAIHHLSGEPLSTSSVSLVWYATGDDAHVGQAASFQLRYALAEIADEADWNTATAVAGLPLPGEIGTEHTLTLGGLAGDTDYFFVGRALDEAGNVSALIPATVIHTFPEGTFLSNLSVSPEFGDTEQTYTFEITYTDTEGDLPVTHDMVIDGTPFAMSYIEGDHETDALYRLETTLAAGAHSHQAFFDDGNGHAPNSDELEGPLVGVISFTVGSPVEELGHEGDESQFAALLTRVPIAASEEVNQAEWTALMGSNPSRFIGADLPVESVTWHEAVAYCNAKSITDGLDEAYVIDGLNVTWNREAEGWRLPTEAEWEWLCRAESETAFHNGEITDQTGDDPVLDASGWYMGNSTNMTHDGGGLLANDDGLHDFHGNVAEWCWDRYAYSYPSEPTLDPEGPALGHSRVIRGGSWFSQAKDCRSAARDNVVPAEDTRLDTVGLRVVRTDMD
jgi:hypothetical protein